VANNSPQTDLTPEELERCATLIKAVPDIVMEVDNNKVYTWANEAGYTFFGKDVIGKPADHYFEGDQKTYDVVSPIFEGGEEIIYVESWQRRKDGKKRLLAWWCRALKDKEGKIKGAVSTARDITERKKQAEELIDRMEQLERFNKLTVGREKKMIELKKEIEILKKELTNYTRTS
jgi:PAS domain S-box-containing protein